MTNQSISLDSRDQKILSALMEDAWMSYVQLSSIVNLSPSATQRRVEKLKSAGLIKGARAIVDPAARGRSLEVFVLVELQDESTEKIEEFRRCLTTDEGVSEAHYVAGADDIILRMSVEKMADYVSFAEQHLNNNPNVKRYNTLTSMKRLF